MYIIFRVKVIAHLRDYSLNITYICTGIPKNFTHFIVIFILLQWSETKPQIHPRYFKYSYILLSKEQNNRLNFLVASRYTYYQDYIETVISFYIRPVLRLMPPRQSHHPVWKTYLPEKETATHSSILAWRIPWTE